MGNNATKHFYNMTIPSDWEVKRFGSICDKLLDGTHFSPTSTSGPYKYITSKNIRNEGLVLENVNYISEKEHREIFKRCPVQYGDILLTKDGASTGACCQNSLKEEFSLLSSVALLRADSSMMINEYLLQFIKSPVGQKIIQDEVSGQAITRITLEKIKHFKVTFPPLPEQRAIAKLLSTWDEAINQSNQLIAQKERRKKWLMQNLLTGKKRLKGFDNTKWKIRPLEDFIKPVVREIPKPNVPYIGIGLRSHGKGTFLKLDEQPEKNSMDKFYVVRPNDLIVNITFAWEQAIAIVRPTDDGALASHRFPTYTFIEGKGDPDFFRFFILQPKMKFMLELISPGGAGRNRVMSKSDFIKLEFQLPDFNEQQSIAKVLQAADKEIQLLKAKTDWLREQKKGLMQVLLTGKKRLKINT